MKSSIESPALEIVDQRLDRNPGSREDRSPSQDTARGLDEFLFHMTHYRATLGVSQTAMLQQSDLGDPQILAAER